MDQFDRRLKALDANRLRQMGRGIEKESLRVHPDGSLALTPHPSSLGAPLAHPHITTDFSESLIELVTGVGDSVPATLQELTEIHQVVCHDLATHGDEMLWASSMPCRLPGDENIPIAAFGTSNIGRSKSIYRMGLAHRYGRRMQTIAGIHYNWSMPGIDSEAYFDLIRNFRRHAFVLLLLFGASPVVAAPFVTGRQHFLKPLGEGSLHLPWATSLRMGRLGYQSDAQANLAVSYNCLDSYADSLHQALTQPYPPYEAMGIQNPGGEYNQLATSLLQIENEFYGVIRPKRVIRSGERPLHALRERGVEYVEVRLMDLNPFEAIGINADTARLIDLFLLHCLLTDSPPDTPEEISEIGYNQQCIAARGRKPGLMLKRDGQPVSAIEWSQQIVDGLSPIASHVDDVLGGKDYQRALSGAVASLKTLNTLPSARVLHAVQHEYGGNYIDFMRARSIAAREQLLALPFSERLKQRYEVMAAESVASQKRIEATDEVSFETFRQAYISPEVLMAH